MDPSQRIQINLAGHPSSKQPMQFTVYAGEGIDFKQLPNTFIELMGAKSLKVRLSNPSLQKNGLHLSLRSVLTQADYLNRLTMEVHGQTKKVATDASGRSASIHLSKVEKEHLDVVLSSEAGTTVHFSATSGDLKSSAHLSSAAVHQKTPFKFFSAHYVATETSTDPIEDELAYDHDTHWLADGATTFVDVEEELTLGPVLGRGHFGLVHKVFDKRFKVDAVAKFLRKSRKMKEINGATEMNNEVAILNMLPVHPNVCRYFRSFETLEEVGITHQDRHGDGRLRPRQHVYALQRQKSH
jgi:hypothetical protein